MRKSTVIRSAELRDIQIHYRRRRSLLLRVLPDKRIELLVPLRTTMREIERILLKKEGWIARRQQYYSSCVRLNNNPRLVDGAEILFLGKCYPLQLRTAKRSEIELGEDRMILYCKESASPESLNRALFAWYREKAVEIFTASLAQHLPLLKGKNRKSPILRLRTMKRLWGSCSNSGYVTLNVHLIKTPMSAINYVIMHELCHLVVMNHGERFYRLMDQVMPDWRQRSAALDNYSLR